MVRSSIISFCFFIFLFFCHLIFPSTTFKCFSLYLMIQGTPVNIIVGSHVWVEDPEDAWIDGEVIAIKGRDATIVATNGKTVNCSIPINYF